MTYYFITHAVTDKSVILTNTNKWSGWENSFKDALKSINNHYSNHTSTDFLSNPKDYIKRMQWSLELELDHLPPTYEELTSNYPELFL